MFTHDDCGISPICHLSGTLMDNPETGMFTEGMLNDTSGNLDVLDMILGDDTKRRDILAKKE